MSWLKSLLYGVLVSSLLTTGAYAQEEAPKAEEKAAAPAAPEAPATPPAEPAAPAPAESAAPDWSKAPPAEFDGKMITMAVDTVWVMVCAMLVFFMNLGFGCVESGMCRAKNCVNILSKNFVVFAATALGFWLLGWGLMFGLNDGGFYGKQGLWMVSGADNSPAMGYSYSGDYGAIAWGSVPLWCKFFFQLVFAATAATIVSGAVAERIKYHTFILFSFAMAILIYPITGHWIWGYGYLAVNHNFWDFAGSTVVHSVGGWAALTGAIILGPRTGKFTSDGKIHAIPGHSMMSAFIGCLVLWFGWFGFNPGSTLGVSMDGGALAAQVAANTALAGSAGTLTATIAAWLLLGKPDIGMTLNGCLAGLVAITAPCGFTDAKFSLLIGAIAGVLVVLSVLAIDRLKIDDPVGAISVHLVNGIFGTICVGLFATADGSSFVAHSMHGHAVVGGPKLGLFLGGGPSQLIGQLVGVGMVGAYVVVVSSIVWLVLKYTVGLRVSPEEELEGLDEGEHGNMAYVGFVMERG